MSRDRIDWGNLTPLPRKKREGVTREQAAERLFHAKKAKHKGRNHFHAWQRRQAKRAAEKSGRTKQAISASKAARVIEAVRAYWRGETDEHP